MDEKHIQPAACIDSESSSEKDRTQIIEDVAAKEAGGRGTAVAAAFTAEEEKRVISKLDWHIMPLIFLLYSLSVLDRSNLGNARIAGMEDDIDISGDRYQWL
jgi:hypothetical protein